MPTTRITTPSGLTCRSCKSPNVNVDEWESSDGAYEDHHFMCGDCKFDWWVDGSDA